MTVQSLFVRISEKDSLREGLVAQVAGVGGTGPFCFFSPDPFASLNTLHHKYVPRWMLLYAFLHRCSVCNPTDLPTGTHTMHTNDPYSTSRGTSLHAVPTEALLFCYEPVIVVARGHQVLWSLGLINSVTILVEQRVCIRCNPIEAVVVIVALVGRDRFLLSRHVN